MRLFTGITDRVSEFFRRRRQKQARKLWVQALRSGEYQQGVAFLKRNNRYCCLGVACEVYQKHVGDLGISLGTTDADPTSFDNEMCHLPEKVCEWLGLNYCGVFQAGPDARYNDLEELNDNAELSFDQIADTIETATFTPA